MNVPPGVAGGSPPPGENGVSSTTVVDAFEGSATPVVEAALLPEVVLDRSPRREK